MSVNSRRPPLPQKVSSLPKKASFSPPWRDDSKPRKRKSRNSQRAEKYLPNINFHKMFYVLFLNFKLLPQINFFQELFKRFCVFPRRALGKQTRPHAERRSEERWFSSPIPTPTSPSLPAWGGVGTHSSLPNRKEKKSFLGAINSSDR